MARRAGAFKSEKRKKELSRIKKREDKMKKKELRKMAPQGGENIEEAGAAAEQTGEEPAEEGC